MSYEFAQPAPKASKKGLLFIAPLALQLIKFIDYNFIWQGSYRLIEWLFAILIVGACVMGILSFIAGDKGRMLTIGAAAGYSILIIIYNIYIFFYDWGGGYITQRIAWITGIPINFNIYSYGTHNILTSFIHALITLSIPLILVVALMPDKSKAKNVGVGQPFNNQQNQQGFGSPQGFSNAPTASYLPPIDNATRIGVQTNMNANPNAQWVVKIPGQQDQAVDTGTLAMWARSGVLRPESLVLDANSGMTYQANQIPGIFSTKQYVTTLLLSFFLGGLGVDRFYLGYTGMGVGKLLTLGGCGIWSLVDFILIAMRKVTDSQGNPLA
jgi:hypothetical protein